MARHLARGLLSLAFVLSTGAIVLAGPFSEFESDFRSVYATYRSALFSTNQKDKTASERDVAALTAGWDRLVVKWAKAPPPQYSEDSTFGPTLSEAAQTTVVAGKKIAVGELVEAHETLEKIRDEFGGLRLRNNISIFSDRMNEFHAEMEQSLKLGKGALDGAGLAQLRGQAAVLHYLAKRLAVAPPREAKDSPDFQPMMRGVTEAVEAVVAAATAGEGNAIRSALDGLKKPYAKLFLKFG